eukprot:TRINITY_DN635_c0_g1_i6.p1 TRINITY_DN635_c0_g1~~TRINITY_DN635_c0_g1_i6.p1  ORF type:complete len:1530 (+),score=545.09 TRINITY_DN635_c0_g1_i6:331-4920(+)
MDEVGAELEAGHTKTDLLHQAFNQQLQDGKRAVLKESNWIRETKQQLKAAQSGVDGARRAGQTAADSLKANVQASDKIALELRQALAKLSEDTDRLKRERAQESQLEATRQKLKSKELATRAGLDAAQQAATEAQAAVNLLGASVSEATAALPPLQEKVKETQGSLQAAENTALSTRVERNKLKLALRQQQASLEVEQQGVDRTQAKLEGAERGMSTVESAVEEAQEVARLKQQAEKDAALEVGVAQEDAAAASAAASEARGTAQQMDQKLAEANSQLEEKEEAARDAEATEAQIQDEFQADSKKTAAAKDAVEQIAQKLESTQTHERDLSQQLEAAKSDASRKTGELAALQTELTGADTALKRTRALVPGAVNQSHLATLKARELESLAQGTVGRLREAEASAAENRQSVNTTNDRVLAARDAVTKSEARLSQLETAVSKASKLASEKQKGEAAAEAELRRVESQANPVIANAQTTADALSQSKNTSLAAQAEVDRLVVVLQEATEAKVEARTVMLEAREAARIGRKAANDQRILLSKAKGAAITASASAEAVTIKAKAEAEASAHLEEARDELKRAKMSVAERGAAAQAQEAMSPKEEDPVTAAGPTTAAAIAARDSQRAVESADKKLSDLTRVSQEADEKAQVATAAFLAAQDRFFDSRSKLAAAKIAASRALRAIELAERAAQIASEKAEQAQQQLLAPRNTLDQAGTAAQLAQDAVTAATKQQEGEQAKIRRAQTVLTSRVFDNGEAVAKFTADREVVAGLKLEAASEVQAAESSEQAASLARADETTLETQLSREEKTRQSVDTQRGNLELEVGAAQEHASTVESGLESSTGRAAELAAKLKELSAKASVLDAAQEKVIAALSDAKAVSLTARAESTGARGAAGVQKNTTNLADARAAQLEAATKKAHGLIAEREQAVNAAAAEAAQAGQTAEALEPKLTAAKSALERARVEHKQAEGRFGSAEQGMMTTQKQADAKLSELERARSIQELEEESLAGLEKKTKSTTARLGSLEQEKNEADHNLVHSTQELADQKHHHSILTEKAKSVDGQLELADEVISKVTVAKREDGEQVASLKARGKALVLQDQALEAEKETTAAQEAESKAMVADTRDVLSSLEQRKARLIDSNQKDKLKSESVIGEAESQNEQNEQKLEHLKGEVRRLTQEEEERSQDILSKRSDETRAKSEASTSAGQVEPAEMQATRAEEQRDLASQRAGIAEENRKYLQGRMDEISQESGTLSSEHEDLRSDLGKQLRGISNTTRTEYDKLDRAQEALADAKRALVLARGVAAKAASEEQRAQKFAESRAGLLREAESQELTSEKAEGEATVAVGMKAKELGLETKDFEGVRELYDRDKDAMMASQKRDADAKATADAAAAEAKRAADEANASSRTKTAQEAALEQAQSQLKVASSTKMQADVERNEAQGALSKLSTQEQLLAERLDTASEDASNTRIQLSAQREAYNVAQATATEVVGKAEQLARLHLVSDAKMRGVQNQEDLVPQDEIPDTSMRSIQSPEATR